MQFENHVIIKHFEKCRHFAYLTCNTACEVVYYIFFILLLNDAQGIKWMQNIEEDLKLMSMIQMMRWSVGQKRVQVNCTRGQILARVELPIETEHEVITQIVIRLSQKYNFLLFLGFQHLKWKFVMRNHQNVVKVLWQQMFCDYKVVAMATKIEMLVLLRHYS